MLPDPSEVSSLAEVVRARRNELGLSQNELAAAVCAAFRPTVTGNEIARWERGERIPRLEARRALEQVLSLPIYLLDVAAANQRARRQPTGSDLVVPATGTSAVDQLRAVFVDSGSLAYLEQDLEPPGLDALETDLDQVMAAYQSSRFDEMVTRLPGVVNDAHLAAHCYRGAKKRRANQALALSGQASAMVLTKLGQHDLAWIASERGMAAAQAVDDPAIVGSLRRSMVHTLQSHGRHDTSSKLAERTADELRPTAGKGSARESSVYGTLLLAAAITSARAGDRAGSTELLDEAEYHANELGQDANHLWTAFGPTNVTVHRVAAAVAQDDIAAAERNTHNLDPSALPCERHIRYLFDVAMIAVKRNRPDEAIATMLEAEQLGAEQVHNHVMAQQIVTHLRNSKAGRQDPRLAQLDRRTRRTRAAA